jgi:hypothetical protein
MGSPHPDGGHNENNQNNANSNHNESGSDNNNNTGGIAAGLNYNGKMSVNDVLRSPNGQQHLHQQYQQLVSAAAANIVAQNQQNNCNSPGVNPATSAAQAVANLAAAMRQNQPMVNGNNQSSSPYHQNSSQMGQHGSQHHHHQHHESDTAMRIHQAEALLRSQAEAALRLAVSQAAAVVASNSGEGGNGNQFRHHNGMPYGQNHHQNNSSQIQSQFSPDLSEALRLQEQRLEQALRLHSGELGLHQQHHQQP